MNVYDKLNKARVEFHKLELTKSGHNKFAGYKYFELGDFVVPAIKIFNDIGLCQFITFTADTATMKLVSTDDQSEIVFTSPMGSASLKGCHEVQNIGAVETYQRRYLWTTVLEIVEHDALDAQTGNKEPDAEKPIAESQRERLTELVDQSTMTAETVCKAYAIESLAELPASKFRAVEKRLIQLAAPEEEAA